MEIGEKDLAKLLKQLAITAKSSSSMTSNPSNGAVVGATKSRGGLTDAKTKFYWEEMLEAVQVIHREGIIHSDLKPANFLMVGGRLKLIDFGIGIAIKITRQFSHIAARFYSD